MKKIIIITFCLLSLVSVSQVTSTGTLMITNVSPYYACQGDSITISFKFKYSGTPSSIPQWSFVYNDNGAFTQIKSFNYAEFYHLSKSLSGTDTIYAFKAIVPKSLPLNTQLAVTVNAGTGIYLGKAIMVQDCTTGITEVNPDEIKPVYFDLYGNKIEPRKNEIIIEQKGNVRRKIIIQ